MTEDQWKAKVVLPRLRKEVGGLWISIPRSPYTRSGISDILGCLVGSFIAIELKREGSKWDVTPTQRAFLSDVRENSGTTFVVKSDDELNTLIKHLQEWKQPWPI